MRKRALLALILAMTLLGVTFVTPATASVPPAAVRVEGDRIGGPNRYDTAALISRRAFPDPFEAAQGRVYLARGDVFADALAAGSLTDGPVLLVPPVCGRVPESVRDEIERLDPAEVVALGGRISVCPPTLRKAADGRDTDRLGGRTRFDTAVSISRDGFPEGASVAYVANGHAPDALAGGVLPGGPILLTRDDRLPEVVAREIERLDPDRVVALGGPASVTPAVLRQAADGRDRARWSGQDRFETSVAIAEKAFPEEPDAVYLAMGEAYADAAAGGALTDGPILLVSDRCGRLPEQVADYLAAHTPARVVALGGEATVCEDTLRRAVAAATPERAPEPEPEPPSTGGGDGLPPRPDELELTSRAEVLTPAEQAAITAYDPTTGELRMDAEATGVEDIVVGDVVVTGVSPETPEGLLRRVTSITREGSVVILTTEDAVLTDVIEDTGGPITATAELVSVEPSGGDGSTVVEETAPLSRMSALAAAPEVSGDVTFALSKTWPAFTSTDAAFRGTGTAEVTGSVTVGSRAAMLVDIGWGGLKRLRTTVTPYVRPSVDLSLEGEFTGKVATTMGETKRVWTFWIGAVPVVVTETSGLEVSVDTEVEAEVTTGASIYGEVTSGFDYDNGAFSLIAEESGNADVDFVEPSAAASAKLSLGPKSKVKFYDAAGMTSALGGYVEAGLDMDGTGNWCHWGAGLAGSVGVVAGIDILGVKLEQEEKAEFSAPLGGERFECVPGGGGDGDPGGEPAPLAITTTTLPVATVGEPYSATLSATGGTAPYRWSVTGGSLPDGLEVGADGQITGTPGEAGKFSFGVTVRDSAEVVESRAIPLTVAASDEPSGLAVSQIAASPGSAMALTEDGELFAWGANDVGQLGDGSTTTRWTPVAVHMPSTSGEIVDIAMGALHSLALTQDGALYAWGSNAFGQLGSIGGPEVWTEPIPIDMRVLEVGERVVDVEVGNFHSLALTDRNRVYVWGSARYLGIGSESGDGVWPQHLDMSAVTASPVTDIAAGQEHSLVRTADGRLYAWGSNAWGVLGDDLGVLEAFSPVAVDSAPFNGASILGVAAGDRQSLAWTDDHALYAWGKGIGIDSQTTVPAPVVWSPTSIDDISVSLNHGLAVANGTVYVWGTDARCQLGDGGICAGSEGSPTILDALSGSTVVDVASGYESSYALTDNGRLFAWGSNLYGNVGNGGGEEQAEPVEIKIARAG